ncbi:MAG: MFS transporter [Proteobacteria bacterium]|nr:MFS transporter [Pseudomonadota bacterium]
MLGISTFSALLPELQAEWGLSNSQAGWITGIYYAGYLSAVPVLVSLTDRVDPRRIYLAAAALAGLSFLGFAFLAEGFWTALLFRTLAGVALAGTYMPGLKALTDRIEGPRQPRAVAFYTSSFGIGVSLSFLLSGEVAAALSWQWAFGLVALGAPLAMAIAAWALTARPAAAHPVPETHLLDFRPVFRNRRAMGYILAYSAHNWELFGLRGWLVAFLVFCQTLQPAYAGWNVTLIVTLVALVAVPSSIIGGELAMRFGRRRVVTAVMTTSAVMAALYGFSGWLPFPLVAGLAMFYGMFVTADSAAITTGAVQAAPPGGRGAVMAVHSCLGFIGAFLGPLAFGVVLDIAGADHVLGWGLAFAAMGAGVIIGPLALAFVGRRATAG